MRIIINDQVMAFEASMTISQLFNILQRQQTGSALAINQIIIPRSQWESYLVNDGDNILLFQAIAGG